MSTVASEPTNLTPGWGVVTAEARKRVGATAQGVFAILWAESRERDGQRVVEIGVRRIAELARVGKSTVSRVITELTCAHLITPVIGTKASKGHPADRNRYLIHPQPNGNGSVPETGHSVPPVGRSVPEAGHQLSEAYPQRDAYQNGHGGERTHSGTLAYLRRDASVPVAGHVLEKEQSKDLKAPQTPPTPPSTDNAREPGRGHRSDMFTEPEGQLEVAPPPKVDDRAETFDAWWSLFPSALRSDRKLARERWCKLTDADRAAALEALEVFAEIVNAAPLERQTGFKRPPTWISREEWKVEPAVWRAHAQPRNGARASPQVSTKLQRGDDYYLESMAAVSQQPLDYGDTR